MRLAWLMLAACSSSPGMDMGGDGPSAGSRLDLNDVSILYPLPASPAVREQFLWLVPRTGEAGPYFPIDLVDQLPSLNGDVPDAAGYPMAMITSLRFDPCARASREAACEAQLRLVAQPVAVDAAGPSMLDDAAAHLFFRLDDAAARAVVASLVNLRDQSPVPTTGRLRVHQALGRPDSAPFAAALRDLVVLHCRAENLLTITTNTFAFDNWAFSRFEFANGKLTRQVLQNMTAPEMSQAWLRQGAQDDLADPSGTITPAPRAGFEYLLARGNYVAGAPRDPDAARAAAAALVRIENPRASLTEEVDCVSCHLATQTRLFAARNGVDFAPSFEVPPGYDTALDLAPEVRGNLSATIAFGWHHTRTEQLAPSISQRVVNESALIAEMLSRE
jgi:hypothetical protein